MKMSTKRKKKKVQLKEEGAQQQKIRNQNEAKARMLNNPGKKTIRVLKSGKRERGQDPNSVRPNRSSHLDPNWTH